MVFTGSKYHEIKLFGEFIRLGRAVTNGLLCSVRSVLSNTTHNGVLCYLQNINSLSQLRYYFDREKLTKHGEPNPDVYVKGIFKTMFQNKGVDVFNTIWNNVGTTGNNGLRQSIFGNRTEAAARSYFDTLIPTLTSDLYSFINVK